MGRREADGFLSEDVYLLATKRHYYCVSASTPSMAVLSLVSCSRTVVCPSLRRVYVLSR
jgi:hypothetical protein